ncbi:MAG: phospholipid scramblase-related protein [Myxococcota bacterium]
MKPTYRSPRKPHVTLQPTAGSLVAWACPETGGIFLSPNSVYHLIQNILGMDFGTLRALPDYTEDRGSNTPLLCSECDTPMKTVVLKDVPVDYCTMCGSLWFDPGELHALTEGRFGTEAGTPVPLKKPRKQPHDLSPRPDRPPQGHQVGPTTAYLARGQALGPQSRADWDAQEPVALMDGLRSLTSERMVRIEQDFTQAEIMLGWESANRYHVSSAGGASLGHILERSEGIGGTAARFFLGSWRPLTIEVVDRFYRQALMDITRPMGLWPVMTIVTATGRRLGTVQSQFAWLQRRYVLRDDKGRHFATIQSPLWRFWTFYVMNHQGAEVAVIRKKWSGFIREAYTSADNFELDFGVEDWSLAQRCILLAAAISIDFDYFEKGHQGSVSAGLLTR